MLAVSTEFRNQLFQDNRRFIPFLDITLNDGTLLHLDECHIWENSMKIEDATSSGGTFTIGAAVTGKLTVTINNIYDDYSGYDFTDAAVTAYIGLKLSGTLEKIRVGTYKVDEPSYDGSTITLSCLDHMTKFDRPYTDSKLKYPATVQQILQDAATNCGVSILSANIPNASYVVQTRPADDALTFGDIVAMAVQIAGCFAKMDPYGRLKADWYPMSVFEQNAMVDGGTFDESNPYATGYKADGGNFTDYATGSAVTGGTFQDQKQYHHIYSTNSLSMSTDDVVITGVRVTEEFEETETEKRGTHLAGKEGYVIDISGNALIQKGKAKTVADYIYGRVGGMRFRPLTAETLADPTVESGDIAYVTDRKQNSYRIFISTRTFTVGGGLNVTCDAETPARNSAKQYSNLTKAVVKARQEANKQLSAYDLAVQQLTNLMTQCFGVFKSEEVLEDGSVIYYMHNKPERANSSTIWKMTADAFAVSTDGGRSWNAGIDSSGNAVVNVLNAIGINADWINTGTLSAATINIGNSSFVVDRLGNVTIKKGSINIGNKFIVDPSGKATMTDVDITGSGKSYETTGWMIMSGVATGWEGTLSFRLRGNFITAFGKFMLTDGLKSGRTVTTNVGDAEGIIPVDYRPKSIPVRTVTSYSGNALLVALSPNGHIAVRNMGVDDIAANQTEITYRADYFVF